MLSMTGYGSAQTERDGRVITVEVKSVNHRFLDLAFRLPKGLMFLEDTLRQGVSARISRGHAEVFVTYKNRRADAVRMTVNEELAALYRDAVSRLAGVLGKNDDCGTSFFASLPDMITLEEAEEDRDAVAALASETLDKALDGLLEMRRREGLRMKGDLETHMALLEDEVTKIEALAPQVPVLYRERLKERLRDLGAEADPQRLAQEVALMADRCAVDEELARLRSHFSQMRAAFAMEEPSGKRMDFLIQEMNREVNTIGSKASDAGITVHVVAAKGEIEKMREQVQNVE